MNDLGLGSLSRIIALEESTYGVHPGGAGVVIPMNTENFRNQINTFVSNRIRSDRQTAGVRGGNQMGDGGFTAELRLSALGLYFKHLLTPDAYTPANFSASAIADNTAYTRGIYVTNVAGDEWYLCVVSGTSESSGADLTVTEGREVSGTATFEYFGNSAPVVHELTAGKTIPTVGITVEKALEAGSNDMYVPFLGCRVDSLQFNIPQEGPVDTTWGLLAGSVTNTSLDTSGFSSEVDTVEDYAVGYDASVGVIGGGAAFDNIVQSMNLNIANNIDPNTFVIGSRQRRDLPFGTRQLTGTFTSYFDGKAAYEYFINEAQRGLTFWITVEGKALKLEYPAVKFTGGEPLPQVTGPGVLSSSFEFQGFTNGTYDVRATLYTADASF